MSRKAAGKQQISIIKRRQAKGSVYVYERISEYNPEKRYYPKSRQIVTQIISSDSPRVFPDKEHRGL